MTVSGIRHGLDGKSYPATPLTRQQRARAIYPAHALVHRGGMSIRQAQKAMLETYQIRRSAGTIADDLARCDVPGCPGCPPPEQPDN